VKSVKVSSTLISLTSIEQTLILDQLKRLSNYSLLKIIKECLSSMTLMSLQWMKESALIRASVCWKRRCQHHPN